MRAPTVPPGPTGGLPVFLRASPGNWRERQVYGLNHEGARSGYRATTGDQPLSPKRTWRAPTDLAWHGVAMDPVPGREPPRARSRFLKPRKHNVKSATA